ncbi:MAG: Rpn family recombination-promoting nuclease/putative transposase [Bacteroidota bacterium]
MQEKMLQELVVMVMCASELLESLSDSKKITYLCNMNLVKKYLNPKNDVAFKRIFGTKKNKRILISMLNAVLKNQLHKPIKNIEFLSPIQPPEVVGSKQSIVDVLCQDKDGCKYIIEMQIGHADGFEERAQYYAAKAFANQAKKGAKYYGLKEIIFLAFCDFSIFPNKKHYKSEHMILDNKTHERNLDKFSFTFVDLVKFDKQCPKSVQELTLEEKFYYFLCHAEEIDDKELPLLIGKDKVIKKAFTELERFGWSDQELAVYETLQKRGMDYVSTLIFQRKEGKVEGIKIGEEKGRSEGIRIGKEKGRSAGIKIGEEKGRSEGIRIGEEKGRSEGIKIGEQKGRSAGIKIGEQKIIRQLLASEMDKPAIAKVLNMSLQALEASIAVH